MACILPLNFLRPERLFWSTVLELLSLSGGNDEPSLTSALGLFKSGMTFSSNFSTRAILNTVRYSSQVYYPAKIGGH